MEGSCVAHPLRLSCYCELAHISRAPLHLRPVLDEFRVAEQQGRQCLGRARFVYLSELRAPGERIARVRCEVRIFSAAYILVGRPAERLGTPITSCFSSDF